MMSKEAQVPSIYSVVFSTVVDLFAGFLLVDGPCAASGIGNAVVRRHGGR